MRGGRRRTELAQSLQQPRTLDSLQNLLCDELREGELFVSRVERARAPSKDDWRREFVRLEGRTLSFFENNALVHSVDLLSISSVKARSQNGQLILVLTQPGMCYYLHTDDRDEMQGWTLAFHTTVLKMLLKELESTPSSQTSLKRNSLSISRSRSNDGCDATFPASPMPRLWSNSEEFKRADLEGGNRRFGDAGASDPLFTQHQEARLRTVDQLGLFDQSFDNNNLERTATRDLSFQRLDPGSMTPSPPPLPSYKTKDGTIPVELQQSDSSAPLQASSPSRMTVTRRDSVRGTMAQSQKRVSNPRIEFNSQDISADHSASSSIVNDILPKKRGAYVPPHLRGYPVEEHHFPEEGEDETDAKGSWNHSRSNVNTSGDDLFFSMEDHRGFYRSNSPIEGEEECSIFGRAADQGPRPSMEDFDVTIPRMKDDSCIGFYAVYDGHSGKRASELASQRLHKYCEEDNDFFNDWPHGAEKAILKAFKRVDEEFFKLAEDERWEDGSCALIVLVHYPSPKDWNADGIAIAQLGDSRAVLFNGKEFMRMCEEHSPGLKCERERIQNAGGWVTDESQLYVDKILRMDFHDPDVRREATNKFEFVTLSRVNGELAVSRALGDIDYKLPFSNEYTRWLYPDDHPGQENEPFQFRDDLVGSVPDFKFFPLNTDTFEKDAFAIVACDGLWEAVSDEVAVECCKKAASAREASIRLVDLALNSGSSDNVTVIVVHLNSRTTKGEEK